MTQPVLHISKGDTSVELPADEEPDSWIKACLDLQPVQSALAFRIPAFSILYAGDAQAKAFNLEYRQKGYATNVLSFPAALPDFISTIEDGFTLGDLIICPEVVEKEAIEQNKTFQQHLAHMTIHGFLHLLGFDHENAEDAKEMEALEIDALAILGMPDPYLAPTTIPSTETLTTTYLETM